MTHRLARLDAGLAVVRRDAIVYLSYRNRLWSQVVTAFLGLVLFYYVSRLVNVRRFPDPDAYFAYVVTGLAILPTLTATLATLPQNLRGELLARTFERVVVSPLGPAAAIAAMTVFPVMAAGCLGAVILLLAATLFGLDLTWTSLPLAVPVVGLSVLAFLPFSLLVSTVVLLVKQAGSLGSLIVIGLSLAGGVYYPVDLMPSWIGWVSDVQPFTPSLQLLRHLVVGAPMDGSPWRAVATLIGFSVVFTPIALVGLRRGIDVCRRRGTLIEA